MTIEDVVPPEAWRTIELTGERYLPWEDGWFTKSSLLLLVNGALYLHGMQAVELYPTHTYEQSVGFDVVGTGRYPMPPLVWNNPEMVARVDTMRQLLAPRRRPEARR